MVHTLLHQIKAELDVRVFLRGSGITLLAEASVSRRSHL